MDEREERKWDKYIGALCDLNYIQPFRHLIHWMLHDIDALREDVDNLHGFVTTDEFDALTARVDTLAEALTALEERVETDEEQYCTNDRADELAAEIAELMQLTADIETRLTELGDQVSDLAGRMDTAEAVINNLVARADDDEEELADHDARIEELEAHKIVTSDNLGLMATGDYWDDMDTMTMDGLVSAMAGSGVVCYTAWAAYYDAQDYNYITSIARAVKTLYGIDLDGKFFAAEITRKMFGAVERVVVNVLPRDADTYIMMAYSGGDVADAYSNIAMISLADALAQIEEIRAEMAQAVEDIRAEIVDVETAVDAAQSAADAAQQTADDAGTAAKAAEETAADAAADAAKALEATQTITADVSHLTADVEDLQARDINQQAQLDAIGAHYQSDTETMYFYLPTK